MGIIGMEITTEQTISKSILFQMQHVILQVTNSVWSVQEGRREWWELGHAELEDKGSIGYGEEFRPQAADLPPASIHCTDTCNKDGQT